MTLLLRVPLLMGTTIASGYLDILVPAPAKRTLDRATSLLMARILGI
jgi:hypothetical protein